MNRQQRNYLKRKKRATTMQLSGEKLREPMVDLEGDEIPRKQNTKTGDIISWTYGAALLHLAHNSNEKDKDADLLWSAALQLAPACRKTSTVGQVDLDKHEVEALEKATEGFVLGMRMPLRELLKNGKPEPEAKAELEPDA